MPLIILYIWFYLNWSTLSGTSNMLAPENSVEPMCDLEGRPKIKRITLFGVIWSFFLTDILYQYTTSNYHNQNGTEPELRSKASCHFLSKSLAFLYSNHA